MPHQFTIIGLVGKHGEPTPRDTLLSLGDFLLHQGLEVYLEDETSQRLGNHNFKTASLQQIGERCDLAIVVGGDGTLLHTARSLVDHDVPLLGINLGRLGFLADISPGEMTVVLSRILAGEYEEERRFLLHTTIDGTESLALNDVVVHKWNIARMIEFETHVDGSFVDAQRSDGLIISTPTGSTAYALSGGGPLLHPSLNATVLVPICPHTLSNRPIVVSGDSVIEIVVCGHTESEHVRVTCDGQESMPLDGQRITIRKHNHAVRLIHPRDHDHFNILRAKLGWGEHPI